MTSAAVAPANSATKPATLLPNMYHVQHQPNQNVAPASTTKNYEYPPSKGKKSWSVRLGLSGRQKVSEEESAEGGSRGRGWGTVNGGGSVLSRQMMYGEPWLYGTVRSSRGVYDARAILAAPTPSTPLLLVCSCPEFLGGTTRRIGGACPKCGTHRLLGLAMGGTCRLPPSTPARSRPSLAGVLRPSVDDPYDLMRRSRLAEPRSRARSTSPQRPQLKKDIRVQSSVRTLNNYPRLEWIEKEPTPEELEPPRSRLSYEESADEWTHTPGFGTVDRRNFPQGYSAKVTPKTTGTERVPRSPKKLPVQQATPADPSEPLGNNRNNNSNNNNNNNNNISKNAKNQMKNDKEEDWRQKLNGDSRRSILECDVNPYMLLKKSKEDDSSDDLSDNALELEERRGPSLFDPSKVKSIERIPNRSAVAAIGGQRIRVFNEPRGHSDDEDFPVTRIPIPKISPKRPPRRLKEVGQTLKSILKRGKVLESKRRKNVLFNVDNVIFAPEKPATRFSWPDLGESTREEAVDDWRESFEEDRDEQAERGEESQERELRKEMDPGTSGVSEEPDQEGEPKPAARTHRRQYNFITIPNIREPKVTRPVEAKSEKVPGSPGDRPPRRLDGPSLRSKILKSDETKTTLDDVLEEVVPEPVSEGKPEQRKIERPKVPFSSNIAVDEKDLILKSEENRRRSLLIRSQSERSCASRPEVTAGSVQFADTMRLNLSKRTKSSGTGPEVAETHPQTRDSICRLILRPKSPSGAPKISELSVDPGGSPEVRAENPENHEASARSEIQVARDPKEEVAKAREPVTSDERTGGSGSPGVLEARSIAGSTKNGESSPESRVLEESVGVEGGAKPAKHFQRMRPTSWSPPPGRQKHQKRNETTVKIRQEPASPVQGQSNGGGWIERKKDEQGSGELVAGGGIKIQQETSGAFQVRAAAVRQDRRSSYPENLNISGYPPIVPPPPQKIHQHRKSEPSLSAVKIHQRDAADSPKHLTFTAVTSCRVEPSRIEVVQEKPRVSDLSSSPSNICKITVSPRVPAMVHRLQVGVQEPAQRTPARTSIIINGNQDSSPESAIDNKVTISVGGEDSVCNPTVISVGSDVPSKIQSPQENRRTLVILDNNNRSNIVLASDGFNQLNGRRGEVGGKILEKAEVEQESKHARSTDEAGSCANLEQDRDKISREEEEGEGEKPVSAIKRRNRPDPEAATSGSVLGPSKEAIISKLLEDSLKKARENGEILDEGSGEAILRILKQSLLKGKEYESSESTIEASYSSKSSSLTSEPDFNSGNLFLEENLYEMIKEPIYEEIPEDPPLPPLPSCPPPSEHHHHRHHRYDKSFFGEPELYYYKNTLESYVNSDVFGKPFPGDLGDFYLSKNVKGSRKKVNSSVEEEEEEEDDDDEEDEENISRKFELLNFLIDAKPKKSEDDDEEVEDDEERENAERDLEALYEQKETSLGDLSSKSSQISNISDSSEECNIILTSSPELLKTRTVDIERTDSGVGSESSHASSTRGAPRRWRTGSLASPATGSLRTGTPQTTSGDAKLCEDCEQRLDPLITDSGVVYAPFVCRKCSKKRAERKEIITEIVETEQKYGRDLQIILDEFHRPMLKAGLLNPEQLTAIFLNVEELLEHNLVLAEKLKDAVEIAQESGDEDLLTVDVGKIFLESERMLHAFESYCTRQGTASLLLQNLEKEKELLRIFLRVSQMENTVLRRMNLNSFLMVPVQRVTKYPLLLARLLKATPSVRPDIQEAKTKLKQAQTNIELHLEHMNAEAKDITSTKLWRRISIIQNGRRPTGEQDIVNIKLRKMAVEILEWAHEETRFVLEGRLLVAQPTDNNWRRGRTIKLAPVTAMLVTNGKSSIDYHDFNDDSLFSKHIGVKEATLLLVKEKIGRYSLLREPLYLDKCIVCCEADFEDYFEIQELSSKETFILKAEDGTRTKRWCRILQAHAQSLGAWRKRRGALPNIMICSVARN